MKLTHREIDIVDSSEKILLRKEYALWFNNHFNNNFSKAVFIDESSFNLHLKRSHVRSKKVTRAIVTVSTIRVRSISLLESMTINGMAHCKTISNLTVNPDIFTEYINELCACLRDIFHIQSACLILDSSKIYKKTEIE